MKFSISREALLKPLQVVIGVVERRQTMPVLSNVLVQLEDDVLSVTGTDLEVEIVGRLTLNGEGHQPGAITVPGRKLMDICRSLPESGTIEFSESEGRAQVQCGRSRFTLATLPASEFPNVEEGDAQHHFQMPQSQLKRLMDATSFSMAQQDVRYYLNGMLLEIDGDVIRSVATDGHRLAMASSPNTGAPADTKVQAILPRKGVMELSRLLDEEGDATVFLGSNHLRVEMADIRFTSKLIDGVYPDYQRVLPRGGDKDILAERDPLKQACGRVSILSNEKYRGVRLQLSEGLLQLQANNPEQEEAQEDLMVDYSGGTLEIGFNVNYIQDVVNNLKGDNVLITLSDPNSSALIQDPADDSALYVVMPMRL